MATRRDERSRLYDDLTRGLGVADRTGRVLRFRYLNPADDLENITEMLHAAYRPLADAGMRYLASHQDSTVTRARAAAGETIVALDGSQVVGIITLSDTATTKGSPFYDQPDVARFGQFAVRPSHQRRGIGAILLSLVERRARDKGVRELGLDTSEHADGLIAFYRAKGYRFVEHCRWTDVNYRSVILAKDIR